MSTTASSTRSARVMVLTSSTRPQALGPAVSRWFLAAVEEVAEELGCQLVPASLAEIDLPLLDEPEVPSRGLYENAHTRSWSEMVDAADAFVVVIPEYNYGMPASLKNALDYLSSEWAWKAIGFVSYGYTSRGTRSVQHAKQVTTTLRLVSTGATVALGIGDCVTDGAIAAAPDRDAAARGLLREVVALTRALRPMRIASEDLGPELPGARLQQLTAHDAGEVVTLQRCCWLDEARVNNTFDLPALQESPTDVERWLAAEDWTCWGVWRDARLLAMVRVRRHGDRWVIGRLATAPDARRQGIASHLLAHAESLAPRGCSHSVVATGVASEDNLAFYAARGYQREASPPDDDAVLMAKRLAGRPVGSLA